MSVDNFISEDVQKAIGGVSNTWMLDQQKPPKIQIATFKELPNLTVFFIQQEDATLVQIFQEWETLLKLQNDSKIFEQISKSVIAITASQRHPEKNDIHVNISLKPNAVLKATEIFKIVLRACIQVYSQLEVIATQSVNQFLESKKGIINHDFL